MEEKDRQSLKELWALFLDDGLNQIIFSSPVNSSGLTKARVRPLYLKGSLVFQLEEFIQGRGSRFIYCPFGTGFLPVRALVREGLGTGAGQQKGEGYC